MEEATDKELRVWADLICAEMFDALGEDEISRAALQAEYRELMTRAEKISNSDWRTLFLENVPEHQAMVEMWDRVSTEKR